MRNLTDVISEQITPHDVAFWLRLGAGTDRADQDLRREMIAAAKTKLAIVRADHGFQPVPAPILTPPESNLKLDKSIVPAYGITLQHHAVRLSTGKTVNACPWAGDCTAVCVLDNGSGRYSSVQRARRWKTELLARYPWAFFVLVGAETSAAIRKYGKILCRPNVNSDVAWHLVAPSLVDGTVFGDTVMFYGYTKDPVVLDSTGWITPYYRVSYSWNETSEPNRVAQFLALGGSVAMVTDRPKGAPVAQPATGIAVDADLTDEWMFDSGTIGDLSAKGRARRLIGRSGFVVTQVQVGAS